MLSIPTVGRLPLLWLLIIASTAGHFNLSAEENTYDTIKVVEKRWYLPQFELVSHMGSANKFDIHCGPQINDITGKKIQIYNGVLTLLLAKVNLDTLKKTGSWSENRQAKLNYKAIPITLINATLFLKYYENKIVKRLSIPGKVIAGDTTKIEFNFNDANLKLAYANISSEQPVEINLAGNILKLKNVAKKDRKAIRRYLKNRYKTSGQSKRSLSQTVKINVPCFSIQQFYRYSCGYNTQIIGCNPPWETPQKSIVFYEEVKLDTINTLAKVYKIRDLANLYVIVPASYAIRQQENIDFAYVHEALNPEKDEENKLVFNFMLGPALSDRQLGKIRKGIKAYHNITAKDNKPPSIIFIHDLPLTPGFKINLPICNAPVINTNNQGYQLSFVCDQLIEGALAMNILEAENTGFSGRINYQLDADIRIASDFILDANGVGINQQRVDMDVLRSNFTLTSNINPNKDSIAQFIVEVFIPWLEKNEVIRLKPENGSFATVTAKVDFIQRLNESLTPRQQKIKYRITVEKLNGNKKVTSWIYQIIGLDPIINITRKILKENNLVAITY